MKATSAVYRTRSRGSASGSRRTKRMARCDRPVHFGYWRDRRLSWLDLMSDSVRQPNHETRSIDISNIFPKIGEVDVPAEMKRLRAMTAKVRETFSGMTLKGLQQFAKDKGFKGYSRLKKDELIEVLLQEKS